MIWRENESSVETGRNNVDIVKESAKSLLQSVLKQLCGLETTSKKIMYMERFVYLLRYDSKDMIPILNVPFLSTKAFLDLTIYYVVSWRYKDQQKVWN